MGRNMIIVNNRDQVEWTQGMTVQNILDKLGWEYALITVTVNEKVIPSEDFEAYEVPDNSDVNVFHLAHGG
jgi:sulfur carrier protein